MTEEFKPYKTNDRGDWYQHPSYGVISINRANIMGGQTPLFGSSIEHTHIITLKISTAELCRGLSRDWISEKDMIVEVAMSATQFADAITGLNAGGDNPVTLVYVKGDKGHRAEPPFQSKVKQFNKEFEEHIGDISKAYDEVIKLAEDTHAQKRLIHALEMLKQQFKNNIPFVNEQFTEQMEHTVKEAKGEVEAFVNGMVHSFGIEAIKNQTPKLPEAETLKLEKGNPDATN